MRLLNLRFRADADPARPDLAANETMSNPSGTATLADTSANSAPPPADELNVHHHAPAVVAEEKGLLDHHDLREFWQSNYFGLGRYVGAHERTAEALKRGRAEIVARFQNTLSRVIERKRARCARLHCEIAAIEGFSGITARQLQIALQHVEREVAVLEQQLQSAANETGWVCDALSRYDAGFVRGARESFQFESLVG